MSRRLQTLALSLLGIASGLLAQGCGRSQLSHCNSDNPCPSGFVCVDRLCEVDAMAGDTDATDTRVADTDLADTDLTDTVEDTALDTRPDGDATNACGGEAVLLGSPGDPCGPCGDGVQVCASADTLACQDASALNDCGGCGVLPELGSACGSCGFYTCAASGDAVCLETGEVNACGGCDGLPGSPGEACFTPDGEGVWVCAGPELACSTPDRNLCGGLTDLGGFPGDTCGACDRGRLVCAGTEALACEVPEGIPNGCGGCAPLERSLGESCGICGDGITLCDPTNPDLVICAEDRTNACGGCAALAGDPGDPCGADGVYVCDGLDAVTCDEPDHNACGGLSTLAIEPGVSCGICDDGVYACASPDAVYCRGAADLNACGGCGQLHAAPGESCGTEAIWECNLDGSLLCVAHPLNACGGEAPLEGFPGTGCGSCGTWQCRGIDAVICDDVPSNPCGGCVSLEHAPGESCGECMAYVCDGTNAVTCEGSGTNVCGGCTPLEGDPGDACPGGVLTCAGTEALACVSTDPCGTGAHDCGDHATCESVGDGTYTCHCDDGYAGDGRVCYLVAGALTLVLPETGERDDAPMPFDSSIRRGDVHINMDTTGSMGDERNTLMRTLSSLIIPEIQAEIPDAAFGVSHYDDFPCESTGGEGDVPFALLQRLTTRTEDAQTAVNSLPAHYGNDGPESGWESLYQIGTGDGVTGSCTNVAPFDAAEGYIPNVADGTIGGVGFREGAFPMVLHVTDAASHDASDYPASYGAHSRAQALEALNAHQVRVIGVASADTPGDELVTLARATNAMVPVCAWDDARPDGCEPGQCCTGLGGVGEWPDIGDECPLVFRIRSNGAGLSEAAVNGILALTRTELLEVTTRVRRDEDTFERTGVDTSCFIRSIEPAGFDGAGACWTEPLVNATGFSNVVPGTIVEFEVLGENRDCVASTGTPTSYFAFIDIIGDDLTVLDTQLVWITVP